MLMGSCTYPNAFTGGDACVQYHGTSWLLDDMSSKCDESGGTLVTDGGDGTVVGCPTDDLAGWCVVDDVVDGSKFESTLMMTSPSTDCDGNEMACTTFVGGRFVPDGACSTSSSSSSSSSGGGDDENDMSMISSLPLIGRCVHSYDISDGMGCFELRGSGWNSGDNESGGDNTTTMIDRCDIMTDGIFDMGVGCIDDDVLSTVVGGEEDAEPVDVDVDVVVAGWCDAIVGDDMHEITLMVITDGADCESNGMVCRTFEGGTFVPDGACAEDGGAVSSSSSSSSTTTAAGGADDDDDDDGGGYYADRCLLAPGAIGAAHQAGYSNGYASSCPDTPGEGSPYMWPMRWSARYESKSMAYGLDDVMHTSRGTTYYMLDRNWKRTDNTYREGEIHV